MSSVDKINQEYYLIIREFCRRFENKINPIDQKAASRTGYIFLFDRSAGNKNAHELVDVASNLTNETMIGVLESALATIKKEIKRKQ